VAEILFLKSANMQLAAIFFFIAVGIASAAFVPSHNGPLVSRGVALQASQNKGLSNAFQAIIQSAVAQAQTIIAQIQSQAQVIGSHVLNLSQQAAAQAAEVLQELNQVAVFAQGQILQSIEGLTVQIQNLLSGTGKAAFLQPKVGSLLNHATFEITGYKDFSDFFQELVQSAIVQAQAIIAQIQSQAQVVAQQATSQLQQLLQQLQQFAVVAQGPALQFILQLIANIQSLLSGSGKTVFHQRQAEFVFNYPTARGCPICWPCSC
jgi:lipopolysaccharide/colanic/teichoic acid biosynthesis glycosyltransferase